MPPRSALEETYILYVRLAYTNDPTISRVLCVPASLEFDLFHLVLQAAFGWAETHLYHFTVSEPPRPAAQGESRFTRQTRELLSIRDSPEDWEDEESMAEAMAQLEGRPATPPVPKAVAAERTLASVFADPEFADGKAEVVYEYDFGDGWCHEIALIGKAGDDFAKKQIGKGVVEGQMTWCVAGEGHPCAEDCGGELGWEELKRAFAGSTEARAAELRTWYMTHCSNGDPEGLEPWKWDIFEVNQRLASLHC